MRPRDKIAIFTAVLFLAALARLAALDSLPPGWRDDELIEVDMDRRIAAGWRPLYIEEAEGHEPLYHYVHAVTIVLFGPSRLSYRWLSAACGLLAVALTMAVGKQRFGWRVALLAGVAMATGFWPLMYSRFGLRHIGVLPALLVVMYGAGKVEGGKWKVERWGWSAGMGLGLAAGLYTYFAGRIAPLILAGFALYLLALHRSTFRAIWLQWLFAAALAVLLFAPLGLYLAQRPLETRLAVVGKPLIELSQGNPMPALETAVGTLGMFTFRGDPEWLYNLSGRPLFDWLTGAFFYLGILVAARRCKRPEYGLLLLWLAIGILPAMVSLPPASFGHTIAAMPAVYLLLAVGLDRVIDGLTTLRQARYGRAWAGILPLIVLAWHGVLAVQAYAIDWRDHPATRFLYHADMADAARYLNRHPQITDVAISTIAEELRLDARGMELDLAPDGAFVRLFDARHALVLPAGKIANVITISDPPLAPRVQALLMRQATLVDSGPLTASGPAFRLYAVRQMDPAAESAPVTFGAQIELMSAALDPVAAPGQVVQIQTTWRVKSAALPETLKLFVHLLSADGNLLATADRLDVWPPLLGAGDQFIQWNDLALPANLAAGRYLVAVGLYQPDGSRWQTDAGRDQVTFDLSVR